MTAVGDFEAAQADVFAQRLFRLQVIKDRLIGLRRDYAQTQASKLQAKANIYQQNIAVSHGERQGMASAQTADQEAEALVLKAEIDGLEDERRFLEFMVTWSE